MFMCFFFVLLDFFIFPLWVYGRKSETLSIKEKTIIFLLLFGHPPLLGLILDIWMYPYAILLWNLVHREQIKGVSFTGCTEK